MREVIHNFHRQLLYNPEIKNAKSLVKTKRFVVVGMGGSHLAADLLLSRYPTTPLSIHKNYGLSELPESDLKASLVILSSHSGNTEEVIDAFNAAGRKNLKRAVIGSGGKLIALAKKEKVPYIQLPDPKIPPRSAIGYFVKGLLKLMRHESGFEEVARVGEKLRASDLENAGRTLARHLKNFIPIIYASVKNEGLAYNWKARLHETGKTPAFHNVFPEVNHNEMASFEGSPGSRHLADRFYFLFLKDPTDHPRILKRMEVTEKLFRDRHRPAESVDLKGEGWEKLFRGILLADWAAYYLASEYGSNPEKVPLIEEFKRLI